jgi:IS30 family transposase
LWSFANCILRAERALSKGITMAAIVGSPSTSSRIRSDNGSEFTAIAVRGWLPRGGVKTLYMELGSPWENGSNESLNGKLRDELLNGEIFYTLQEAKVLIERWRQHYNTIRPHSSLGYRPPAPVTILPKMVRSNYPETVRTLSQQLDH